MQTADVYLPPGEWFDFWDTKTSAQVGPASASVKLDPRHVPVYVRSGSIIFKKMRRRRSTGAMVADPYSLFVFGARAKGRLYIDDFQSHDYQRGDFIYDEFEFNGMSVNSRSGLVFNRSLAARGLPSSVPKRHLR